tara:strand:+ start:3120 stop:3782 length:663 start_codon:yes stop_codon:yes gene_type:complete
MGGARRASQSPDPVFKENLERLTKMPESRERSEGVASLLFFGGAPLNNVVGRASGGASMLDTPGGFSGIIKPSASATIKAPEPTPEPKEASNMQMFVGSDLSDKAEFSRKTGLTEVDPTTEERIKDLEEVKDDLLAKAKERRSKTQEVKEEAMSRMSMPSGLDQFGIQNYRAGGAKFDRGEDKFVGDDMNTGKPSASERAKSFLGDLSGKGGFSAVVRTK